MDKTTENRIREICTQIGTIMEDASVVALIWEAQSGLSVEARLQLLPDAHRDIGRHLDRAVKLIR